MATPNPNLIYRTDQSGSLTYEQLDGNFAYLSQSIANIVGTTTESVTIGSLLTIDPVSQSTTIFGSVTVSGSNTFNNVGPMTSGVGSVATNNSFAHGYQTKATNQYSHTEGYQTSASGIASHAEGVGTRASGFGSHAEGYLTIASGQYSSTQGNQPLASSDYSHAEGQWTTSSGDWSHAEGQLTRATNDGSHAEGYLTIANKEYAHTEGLRTLANGYASHAEGQLTTASSDFSHAEGYGTITTASFQHAQGVWNLGSPVTGALIVGNGSSNTNRRNLLFAGGNNVEVTGSFFVKTLPTSSQTSVVTYNTSSGQFFSTPISSIPFTTLSSSYAQTASYASTGGNQNLQSVTNNGASTSASISITDGSTLLVFAGNEQGTVAGGNITVEDASTGIYTQLKSTEINLKTSDTNLIESALKNDNVTNNGVVLQFPNKTTGDYTIATTTDLITSSISGPSGSLLPVSGGIELTGNTRVFITASNNITIEAGNSIGLVGSTVSINNVSAGDSLLRLPVRTTTPGSPVEGSIMASGSAGSSKLYYYNGTTWVDLTA